MLLWVAWVAIRQSINVITSDKHTLKSLSVFVLSNIIYVSSARSNIGNVFSVQALPKAFLFKAPIPLIYAFVRLCTHIKSKEILFKCISWPTISSAMTSQFKDGVAVLPMTMWCIVAASDFPIRTVVRQIFRPAKMCLSSRVVVRAVCASNDWFEIY